MKQENKAQNSAPNSSKQQQGSKGSKGGRQPKKDSRSKRVNYDNTRKNKFDKDVEKGSTGRGRNDVTWYSRNPELMRSAGSLPFASINGQPMFGHPNSSVPGVMAIGWSPFCGAGFTPIALNQAADSMYSFVVHANSRNYSYTAPDLMIMILAGMDFYASVGKAILAYGILKYYNERNLYLPDGLLKAINFDAKDLRANLSQMWFDINNIIDQSRQIWIPNTMPLLSRWYWLSSNVFTDAEGQSTAQMYVFNKQRFFKLSEVGVTTGTALVPTSTNYNWGDSVTWAQYRSLLMEQLNALISSEDRGIMYGDLLNAYGMEKMYVLNSIPADYTVVPVYNAEVLSQIENVTQMSWQPGNVRWGGLFQQEEDIHNMWLLNNNVTAATATTIPYGISGKQILNLHTSGQPTPELVMESTRLKTAGFTSQPSVMVPNTVSTGTAFTPPETPETRFGLATAGSEIVDNIVVWYRDVAANGSVTWSSVAFPFNTPTSTNYQWLKFMAFDWHPFLYTLDATPSQTIASPTEGATTASQAFGDYDNYIELTQDELSKLHDTALLSLFGVPIA